jgi:hypothetical protein
MNLGSGESPIPRVRDDDPEEVADKLSVAIARWAQGDSTDALTWLRRAAEAASDADADVRALELAKASSALADALAAAAQAAPPAPPAPPPSASPSVSAPPLPKPSQRPMPPAASPSVAAPPKAPPPSPSRPSVRPASRPPTASPPIPSAPKAPTASRPALSPLPPMRPLGTANAPAAPRPAATPSTPAAQPPRASAGPQAAPAPRAYGPAAQPPTPQPAPQPSAPAAAVQPPADSASSREARRASAELPSLIGDDGYGEHEKTSQMPVAEILRRLDQGGRSSDSNLRAAEKVESAADQDFEPEATQTIDAPRDMPVPSSRLPEPAPQPAPVSVPMDSAQLAGEPPTLSIGVHVRVIRGAEGMVVVPDRATSTRGIRAILIPLDPEDDLRGLFDGVD